jgi:hypothetical protein
VTPPLVVSGMTGCGRCSCAPISRALVCSMRRLTGFLRELRDERRARGWRGLFRHRGWKLVAVVVAYYLVRDVLLYIVIPLGVAAGFTR